MVMLAALVTAASLPGATPPSVFAQSPACPAHIPMNNTCNGYCGSMDDGCTRSTCFSCITGFDDGCLSSCTGSEGRAQWAANSPDVGLYWRDTDNNTCHDMAVQKVYPEKNVCGHGGTAAYCGSAYVPKFVDGVLYAAANFILDEGEQECGQLYSGWASTDAITFKTVLKMVSYKRAVEKWIGFRLYVPGSGAGENVDGLDQVYPALYQPTCMGPTDETFASCQAHGSSLECAASPECVWSEPISCEGDKCAYLHFSGGIQTRRACALLGNGSDYQTACEQIHHDLAQKWESAHVLLQSIGPASTEDVRNFNLYVGHDVHH